VEPLKDGAWWKKVGSSESIQLKGYWDPYPFLSLSFLPSELLREEAFLHHNVLPHHMLRENRLKPLKL
jgi:hypothetical protein